MRAEVRLPQWGMGQDEGTLSAWHVAVGDEVAAGDVLASVETAKVDGEIEAVAAGRVAEIVVQVGETVETGALLAVIETES